MKHRIIPYHLWVMLGLVYLVALFMPLMENDSAQFAVMAMRMAQESDFIHLFKNGIDYLDKPHMHYWLAALSFKLFGYAAWAYRLPSFLALVVGAYALYRLGTQLKSKELGVWSAFVFLSFQTMVLASFDLRTDSLLSSFVAIASWKLISYIRDLKWSDAFMGAIAAGLAFSTKGMIALVVLGFTVVSYAIVQGRIRSLFTIKVLGALTVFVLTIIPVLYAYHQQFDLHPEKIVRGLSGRSGVRFILWDQSFERLSGTGHGKSSSGYFFFFHTLLWVLLPFTFYTLKGWVNAFRTSFGSRQPLFFVGVALIPLILLMSASQFKLPHYLNILMPLFALLTAKELEVLSQTRRTGWNKIADSGTAILYGAAVLLLWVFFMPTPKTVGIALIWGVLLLYYQFKKTHSLPIGLIGIALLFNAMAFFHFYPQLLNYQSGQVLSERIPSEAKVFNYSDDYLWSLEFGRKQLSIPKHAYDIQSLSSGDYVYVDTKHYATFKSLYPQAMEWASASHFRVTRLNIHFLKKNSREEQLSLKRIMVIP